MCVVVGKYFKDVGWVGVKNRDRNYIPEISFRKKIQDNTEILYFWDDITQYSEGLNSAGICILSASLMVLDDEKEITTRAKTPSKDGTKIRKALAETSLKSAVKSLIDNKLTGCTLVFNKETMILIEGAWADYAKKDFEYKIGLIPHDHTVARTNHGIWLKGAGYQRTEDDVAETTSRISSEARLHIAEHIVDRATTPQELIDNLCKTYIDDPQLNAFRTTDQTKKMRTTAQIMMIPSDRTMYVRPVQSHMVFDFWNLNDPAHKTWVELLSNRALYVKNGALDLDTGLGHKLQSENR